MTDPRTTRAPVLVQHLTVSSRLDDLPAFVSTGPVSGRAGALLGVRQPASGFRAGVIALLWVVVACAIARADDPSGPGAIGELPADADTVLLVQNATRLRASSVGRAALGAIADEGMLAPIAVEWVRFADELGWGEEEAFDKLLGRRVVFVSRNQTPAKPGLPDRVWVVLTDVSPEVYGRLRERLAAAPRAVALGHQVLSIERGRFELTGHRRPNRPADRSVTLIIAPSEHRELFDQMLRSLGPDAGPSIRDTPAFRRVRVLGDADVVLALRLDPPGGPGQASGADWKNFAIVSGRAGDGGGGVGNDGNDPRVWSLSMILRDQSSAAALSATPLSSDAEFRLLRICADLAIIQREDFVATISPLATPAVRGALQSLALLGQVKTAMPEAARRLVSGHQGVAMNVADPQHPVFTLALQTSDRDALAAALDPAIADFLLERERRAAPGASNVRPAPPPNFAGFSPRALRVVPLSMPPGTDPLPLVLGGPVTAAWSYPGFAKLDGLVHPRLAREGGGVEVGVGGEREAAPRAGWWSLTLASPVDGETAGAARPFAEAFAADPALGVMDRWLWLGGGHPARFERAIPALLAPSAGVRAGMHAVEDVELKISATDDGDLVGQFRLRLMPSPEPVPASAPAPAAAPPRVPGPLLK